MPIGIKTTIVWLLSILVCCQTASTNTNVCPEKQFFDHEAKKCAPCSACQSKDFPELCRDICAPAFNLMVRAEQKPERAALSMEKNILAPSGGDSSTSGTKTTIFIITGIVGSIVVVVGLTILGLTFSKMQQNGSNPIPNEEVADGLGHEVQEMDEHAEDEKSRGWLYAMCDPRNLVSKYLSTEETKPEQEGHHEAALLGNGQGPAVPETTVQPKTHHMVVATPIFKPSGSMWSSSHV